VDDEHGRLAAVYQAYDHERSVQRKWSPENPGNQFLGRSRTATFDRLFASEGLTLGGTRILDVGCGTGEFLRDLCERGATPTACHGVDILADRIQRARERSVGINFHACDARTVPFEADSFDLVFANMVFGSVLSADVSDAMAAEIRRALAPQGAIVWYDHRYPNPWNRNVRAYTRRDLERLFPGFRIHAVSVGPLPPLVRRLGRMTPWIAPALDAAPVLRVEYLAVIRSPV